MKKVSLLMTMLLILSTVLSACGGAAPAAEAPAAEAPAADAGAAAETAPSGEADTIEYWRWDANQLPAYQACADAFTAANPNI